jgi:hypothetical protein
MAFRLGDIIIDRLQYGYAEDFEGNPLYNLTQLQEATIEVTSDPVEVRDKDGNLVKKIYRSKDGVFNAQNAFINTDIIAAASGIDPVFAKDTDDGIKMPKLMNVTNTYHVDKDGNVVGATAPLAVYGEDTPEEEKEVVDAADIKVSALEAGGKMGERFGLAGVDEDKNGEKGTPGEADATHFAFVDGVLHLPKVPAEGEGSAPQFIVRYMRKRKMGAVIKNQVTKFPKSCRLILKAVYFDPCDKDTLRGCYVEFPSFQVSPEVSIPLQTEAQIDFKGDLEVDYCSIDKTLYNIYFPGDEEEYYAGAIANGVKLLTCNDPKKALDYLRSRGLHE